MDSQALLDERKRFSCEKLEALRKRVQPLGELRNLPQLCIYATGSFGRQEASRASDLDLFLVHDGDACPKIATTLIAADLIRACRELELPEFSGDGKYLQVHPLSSIQEQLGSNTDDYQNLFTARLLLLLESAPVSEETLYHRVIEKIIDSYYRDYHDHNKEFQPIFLTNDIIRFWKTLCLNYEHRRNRPPGNPREKNKGHLNNLKLKFSRMTTCMSAVMALAQRRTDAPPQAVWEVVQQTPLERLKAVANNIKGGDSVLKQMFDDYAYFLTHTGQPEHEVLQWISHEDNRIEAFCHARSYGDGMFNLLTRAVEPATLRFLVI